MNKEENKNKYIELLRSTNRGGVEELIAFLENSDFFEAPASSVYHNNFPGGLCEHSLNVYNNIMFLKDHYCSGIPNDSCVIVALLHDLSKAGYYERYIQNKKDYNSYGRQSDAAGKFDWIQVESYKVKDVKFRDAVYGEHGLNSYMIASKFITMSDDEAAAIINHHMTMDNGRPRTDISEILNRYPLAEMLCLADQVSAYIDENYYKVNE